MSIIIKDRVQQLITSEGTGIISGFETLGGFQDFSVLPNGTKTFYTLQERGNWEVGIGTYSGGTLTRDSVLDSSAGSALISLSGNATGFITYPADKAIYKDDNDRVGINVASPSYQLDVSGTGNFAGVLSNNIVISENSIFNNTTLTGNIVVNNGMNITGDVGITGDIDLTGNLNVFGNTSFTGNVDVTGDLTVYGDITGDTLSLSTRYNPFDQDLDITGNVNFNSLTVVTGVVGVIDFTGNNVNIGDGAGDGTSSTLTNAINIGIDAGEAGSFTSTFTDCINIGRFAGEVSDGIPDDYLKQINIGYEAGRNYRQSIYGAINIGDSAGGQGSGANINIGRRAGYKNQSNNIVAIGSNALSVTNTEYGDTSSIAIGVNAFADDDGGAGNASNRLQSIAIGDYAGYRASGVSSSQFIGRRAGWYSKDINNSVYIGFQAGARSSGQYNSIIGYSAGVYVSGDKNLYLGRYAGYGVVGDNNVEFTTNGSSPSIIGSNNNKLNIQNTIIGDTSTKKLAIGDVGSGNLSPDATLEILPAASTDVGLIVQGAISQSENLTEWIDSSDNVMTSIDAVGNIDTTGNLSASGDLVASGSTYVQDISIGNYGARLYSNGTNEIKMGNGAIGGQSIQLIGYDNGAGKIAGLNLSSSTNGSVTISNFEEGDGPSGNLGLVRYGATVISIAEDYDRTPDYNIIQLYTNIVPYTDDAASLGNYSKGFNDVFLSTGAQIKWGNATYFGLESSGTISVNDTSGLATLQADTLQSNTINATGLITAATGITLQRNTPAVTTDKLYNISGELYFNGTAVSSTGLESGVAFYASNGETTYNSNFVFDNTNNFLGVGNSSPSSVLDVSGTGIGTSLLSLTVPSGHTGHVFNVNDHRGNSVYAIITGDLDPSGMVEFQSFSTFNNSHPTGGGLEVLGRTNTYNYWLPDYTHDIDALVLNGIDHVKGSGARVLIKGSNLYQYTTSNVSGDQTLMAVQNDDGTEYMTVLGTGYVGINNITPSYQLDVSGTGNFDAIRFSDGTLQSGAITGEPNYLAYFGADSGAIHNPHLRYNPAYTGLLIGSEVNDARNTLEVVDGDFNYQVSLSRFNATAEFRSYEDAHVLIRNIAGNGSPSELTLMAGQNGDAPNDNQTIGQINFNQGRGAGNVELSKIKGFLDGASSNNGGRIDIFTTPSGGGTYLENRLSIRGDGDVGINQDTPDAQFHVVNDTSTDVGLIVEGAISQSANLVEIKDSSSNPLLDIDENGYISVYNNYISASHHEAAIYKWNSNVLQLGMEAIGTGTLRNVEIKSKTLLLNSNNSNLASLQYAGTNYWEFTTTKLISVGSLDLGDSSNTFGTLYTNTGQLDVLNASGLITAATGISLLENIPSNTTGILYNPDGNLYFNGTSVAPTGSQSGILFYGSDNKPSSSSNLVYNTGGYVGINQPNPTHALEISGSDITSPILSMMTPSGHTGYLLKVDDHNGSGIFGISNTQITPSGMVEERVFSAWNFSDTTGGGFEIIGRTDTYDYWTPGYVHDIDAMVVRGVDHTGGIGARVLIKGSNMYQLGTVNVSGDQTLLAVQNDDETEYMTVLGNGYMGLNNTSPSYQLDVSGTGNFSSGVRYPDGNVQTVAYNNSFSNITGDYEATFNDYGFFADASAGNILITLPTGEMSKEFHIIRTDASGGNSVTVTGYQNFNGAESMSFSQYDSSGVVYNGTQWFVK